VCQLSLIEKIYVAMMIYFTATWDWNDFSKLVVNCV
jgi:hypothetical protein